MATKKKTRRSPLRGRILSAALSLGLLAAAGMVGMYTVGKSEQRKQEEELAEKVAEAEKAFEEAKQKEAELKEQQEEAERRQAASESAQAEFPEQKDSLAELESDFAAADSSALLSEEEQAALDAEAEAAALQDAARQTAEAQETASVSYSFSPESDSLLWPVAGNIILDYSMDKTVYFATLEQYKYNPAVLIQGQVGQEVLCCADGKVEKIEESDELGTTVTVDLGSGYEAVYGQLKEVAVKEGSSVKSGQRLGLIDEPTRYYAKEGPNVYFKILKDGTPVDPMDLLQ